MKKSLFLLYACGIILAACSPEKEVAGDIKFKVVNPLLTDTVFTTEYVADIQSVQNVEIRSRIKGYLEKVNVDEGNRVRAGQILFKISDKDYLEELNKATAVLKTATAEAKLVKLAFNDTKLLIEKKVITGSQVEVGKAKVEAADARVEEAKANEAAAALNLSFTEIRAPFDGVINRIPNKTGSLIDEGTLLTTISNNKEVFVYFNVSEREYLDIRSLEASEESNEVSLVLANGQIYPQKGKIETVEGEFNKTTGNIAFRARFNNPDDLLKHGSSGKIQFNKRLKNVLVIPQKSTFEVQEKICVFVVDNNNVVQIKSFVPEFRLPNLYVVQSGLNAADKIIFEGIQLVKEGDKVIPQLIPSIKILESQTK